MLLPEGEEQEAGIGALLDSLLKALECKWTVALLKGDNPIKMVPRFLFCILKRIGVELGKL